ncbi:DUF2813 domain-containing protein, partial [Listeria monocytogenes]|nr:DUF2813 domain-containing protein [Listeria monocytogenes]
MYIAELEIEDFRGFKGKNNIFLNSGVNVFIGQNNSGKTTIIKVLELLFSEKSNKRLKISDFQKDVLISQISNTPPKIILSAKIS